MTTLFLAWQASDTTRAWFPIGRLEADPAHSLFSFCYTYGAQRAADTAGLRPLESFPDFYRRYESGELFPLFRNRVMNSGRGDFGEYLNQLDLNPDKADPISILSVSGGTRQTDNLAVFPKIERQEDGRFHCRFFLHGSRYTNEAGQRSGEALKAGDDLRIALELNNPATRLALQAQTSDYHMLGWTPRYLIDDLKRAIDDSPDAVTAKVIRINPPPAPSNQRVLIELSGRLPAGYTPMSEPDFKPICA